MRFGDFLKATVLLSAASSTLLAALTVIGLGQDPSNDTAAYVCAAWWALSALIGIWLGYAFPARVAVCVIIALFPMIANTLFGLQSASAAAHDLFTLNKATRWQRLTKLQFPAAVPSIFTGLRNAAGLSVIGAIVGDYFF